MNDYLPKPFSPTDLFGKIMALAAFTSEQQPPGTQKGGPLVDLSYLREMSGNSQEFEREMISLFLDQVPAELAGMEQAILQPDYESVGTIAHKLKSSYSMMGVRENGLLQNIETQGAFGVPLESLIDKYEQLSRITQAAIKELNALLREM